MSTQEMRARLDELSNARQAFAADNTMKSHSRVVNAQHEIKHHAEKDIAALLELIEKMTTELHQVADYLADKASQDACTAGNFDGGSAWTCEHCQTIEWMNRIDKLIAEVHP